MILCYGQRANKYAKQIFSFFHITSLTGLLYEKKKKKHLLWSVNNQTKNLPARHFSTAETLPPPSPCKHSTSNNVPSHNMQDKENNVLYFIQMTSLTAHASKSTHAHKRYYLLHKFTAKCLWSNKKVCGIYINK